MALQQGCTCVYYGDPRADALEALRGCRLLVLPPTADAQRAKHVTGAEFVLGYASLTTIGGWEPWAERVSRDLVIGERREWNEKIVDVCDSRWVSVIEYATGYIISRGFDGVFFDNLDLVDEYRWMSGCAANLIARIRRVYGDAVIMVNRGFSILEAVAPYIDHLLVESYPSYYDGSGYRLWNGDDLEWIVGRIREAYRLSGRYGFGIHALAYGDPRDKRLASMICDVVERYTPWVDVYLAPWLLKKPGRCLECSILQSKTPRKHATETRVAGEARGTVGKERVRVSVELGPVGLAGLGVAALLALLVLLRLRRGRG